MNEPIRLQDLMALKETATCSTTRTCEERGCNKTTRVGKPFCPGHIERLPYVRKLMQELADKKAEEDKVKINGRQAVRLDGLTAKELILHLSLHGERTVERLSRELQLEPDVIWHYIKKLEANNQVVLGSTKRGNTIVCPINGAA